MRPTRLDGVRQLIRTYIKERPYGLLLVTAIALSLALVFLSIAYVDFQDITMFSVPLAIMIWLIPSLLIFFWLVYLPTKNFFTLRPLSGHMFLLLSLLQSSW
jgi:hypothetical protein